MLILFIILACRGLGRGGLQATRAGYESAPYEVVRSNGMFEVRDYPALRVVETPMSGAGAVRTGVSSACSGSLPGGTRRSRRLR